MKNIAKEQFKIAKSEFDKSSIIEYALDASKVLLDVASSLGDDVFNSTILLYRNMLNDIAFYVFGGEHVKKH